MGIFFQKLNITRDFLEDHIDGRPLWPREIWAQYVDSPEELLDPKNRSKVIIVAIVHLLWLNFAMLFRHWHV